ncbi:ataxin-2 homolog isoform X2 [Culicoides brevitarsis]|uniref:ataxin-2 homolog isoform X2 n=1 Tax=Culicoides brevitarsis TaxID=469753 RepID=UPI00307C6904
MKQNNTRKAQNQRTGNARPKGKVVPTEGVYNNHPYMHAATSQVGNIVYVRTQSGAIYEGIFRTFSPNFSVVLEVAHKVDTSNGDEPQIALETVCNTFVFKPDDIVSIHAKNVDLDYATRDTFATDTAISKLNGNSRSEDRELEPWDPSGSDCLTNGDYDLSLQLEDDSHGWDANEMFQKNESIYGVQSTFDPQLAGYTVGIKKNTEDYREIELAAAKIASEIENNPVYLERVDLENNDELDDEEAKFSAVIRDNNSSSPLPQRQTNSKESASSRQSEQRSDSTSSSAQVTSSNNTRETHNNNNNRESRGSETPRDSNNRAENHVDKAQSPPTVQHPAIPQVSAQPERISNQGSQERSHHPHHHQHHPQQQQHHSGNNANNMPNPSMHLQQQNMNNTNNVPSASKYVPHAKTGKMGKGNRTMRGTPPPNNNSASGPPTPQSPHTPQVPQHQQQQGGKQNNYMLQQQQQPQNMGPAPQYLAHGTPLYTQHVHNQATAGKLNGQDQNNANQNNKMGQRSYRYPQNTNVNAPPPQNVGPQMKNIQPQQLQMGKPIHHVQLAPSLGHMPPPDGQTATHIVVPHQIVVQPQAILQAPAGIPNQSPMPQRQQRSRDETTENLRKFHNNFKMDTSSQHPQDARNQQSQQQQQQQNDNTTQQQQQQQQIQHQQSQQGKPQREQRHQQQQNQQNQQQQPIVNDAAAHQMQMQPPQQQQQTPNAPSQHPQGPPPKDAGDNGASSTPGTKKFVLNPAAKPFTPRTPATPSATRPQNSRPHTPQTPSSTMQTQVMAYAPPHTPGPIVAASPNQPQMMTIPTYVVQQPFQAPPRQPKRPLGASVQVAAATGQPLLAPGPGPFVYPQPPFPQAYTFRMPFDAASGQQIQYITATPPSTTPSPGQAQQFHPGPQPSPASQAATAYMPIQQQGPHVSFPVLTTNGPQIIHSQYFQPTAGPHGQPQPYILMQQPQHPSTQ